MINVTEAPYSATGDGTTDDTSAIASAISAGGTELYFPSGKYRITSSLPLINYGSSESTNDNDRIRIRGDGIGNTWVSFSGAGNLFQVQGGEAGNGNFAQFTMSDMQITGSGAEN